MSKRHNTNPSAAKKFIVRRSDTIGNIAAESDQAYLKSCFVNNEGELDRIRNCSDERGIVIGRTGAGKTALLKMLQDNEERALAINLQELSLEYLSNSPVLRFFESLDINMSVHYRALWKHVMLILILQRYFEIYSERDKANPWDVLRYRIFRKQTHLDGLEYLRTMTSSFWITSKELVNELRTTIETELKASVDIGLQQIVTLGAEGARHLTVETRKRLQQIGQEIVSKDQMGKLTALFGGLNETILRDRQKQYYVVVDGLDEDWVDDAEKYHLIRALIEVMKEVNSTIDNAKVVIALRTDLFDRVLENTTDSGFQDEKYRALCLQIKWTENNLFAVLDRRINQLIASRYSNSRPVGFKDIFPATLGDPKEKTSDFVLARSLMRPRDVISFCNICIEQADGQLPITPQQLRDAEVRFSRERLQAVLGEWNVTYPYLSEIARLLTSRPMAFGLDEFTHQDLEELSLSMSCVTNPKVSEDHSLFWRHAEGKIDDKKFRQGIALILYRTGVVGLKLEPHLSTTWSEQPHGRVRTVDISDVTRLSVHKMFWRALGTIVS